MPHPTWSLSKFIGRPPESCNVTFLNSKLLDTLVRISAGIHPRDGGVVVLTSQTYVKHMLEVTEAGGVLLLEDDRDAALTALG